jgi:hypothetical protein
VTGTTGPHNAALPFTLKRERQVIGSREIVTTTEKVHGLLRLHGDTLTIQWRVARSTDTIGTEIRTDEEVDPVREVTIPLAGIAGATVRQHWTDFFRGPRLILTAADLRAFEDIAGFAGLQLDHPARLTLRLRKPDRLAAHEFAAELQLALAERLLEARDVRGFVTQSRREEEKGD